VVIGDKLLPQSFLEDLGIPSGEKCVHWLGGDGPREEQEEINHCLSSEAQAGKVVVRLKGGDPLVFGRGTEEADHLSERGIPWEIIPGPSSVTAVLTAAGIPLTQRSGGRSFAVATARCIGGGLNSSFPHADTLVILMAVKVIEQVASSLLADGWLPDTPAALLERGTLHWERRVAGTLAAIPALAESAGIASPAILVVGCAASPSVRPRDRPRVLFTGLDPEQFRSLGDLLHWPALRLVECPRAGESLAAALTDVSAGKLGWVFFTDKIAVRSFLGSLPDHGHDARLLAKARIGVQGRTAETELRQHGLLADAVLGERIGAEDAAGLTVFQNATVLVVQGTHTPTRLVSRPGKVNARVRQLVLSEVAPNPDLGRPLPEHDIIYFVSPSGVRAYWDAYGAEAFRRDIWCLGDQTLAALEEVGVSGEVVRPDTPAAFLARA